MSGGAGWSLETWRASRVRAFQEAEALLAQAARPRRCSRDPLLPPLFHTGSSPRVCSRFWLVVMRYGPLHSAPVRCRHTWKG